MVLQFQLGLPAKETPLLLEVAQKKNTFQLIEIWLHFVMEFS